MTTDNASGGRDEVRVGEVFDSNAAIYISLGESAGVQLWVEERRTDEETREDRDKVVEWLRMLFRQCNAPAPSAAGEQAGEGLTDAYLIERGRQTVELERELEAAEAEPFTDEQVERTLKLVRDKAATEAITRLRQQLAAAERERDAANARAEGMREQLDAADALAGEVDARFNREGPMMPRLELLENALKKYQALAPRQADQEEAS